MPRLYHVTSVLNRESIAAHGLDWTRMGAAPGIAGSRHPEQAGCFVCVNEFEVSFFLRINNTGGPVDVWAIEGVDPADLIEPPNGFQYLPRPVAPAQLSLHQRDIAKVLPGV